MKHIYFTLIISILFSLNSFAQSVFIDVNTEISNGNYNKANELAKVQIDAYPNDIKSWELLAKTYKLLYKYNEAIKAYNKALEIESTNISIKLSLARLFYTIGNETRSVLEYKSVINIDSVNVSAMISLSKIYLDQKQHNKAFKSLQKLHKTDTLNSEFLRQMGVCKYRNSELIKALKLFEKSYNVNNENLKSIYWLADIYTRSDKKDTAESIINLAIKSFPKNGKLYEKRANINYRRNHHYRAIPDYKKAIELGYVNYNLKKNLGKSLYAVKKYLESMEIFEKFIIKDTIDYQATMYLADINKELKNYNKSLMFYNKTINLLEPSPKVLAAIYSGISDNYANQEMYQKQIQYIVKRHNTVPNSFNSNVYLLEIAKVYDRNLNDNSQALKYYEKYWASIKSKKWYGEEYKEKILSKINRLKEQIHFQK